ncbi:pirin [Fibrella forsythiae]|uniref:Pirin n=1 Tax=Fibrella forsythiae TaxID=2817061 RepID=A0ABS3JRC0_9BACT|nr:pirin [Fibrella forsythiae]MBO0952003.1 pirin [Fibrella forsythiae]
MNNQSQAQIFLADGRGRSETDTFRSYHTFNFGRYVAEGREPFGKLYLLNDDMLRPETSLSLTVEQPTDVVLMPIVGGLEYVSEGETHFLEPGQAGIVSLRAGMTYTVTNPYPTELINYLQLWFASSETGTTPAVRQVVFDLTTPNTLLPFLSNVPGEPQGFIGRFAGRVDGTYLIKSVQAGEPKRVFVFVLQGAFEVANRLMHEKDGLSLTYQEDDVLEFEALSNDAVLLITTC